MDTAVEWPTAPALFTAHILPFLSSWWAVALLFAIANYKSMPGVWTARTWYHLTTAFRGELRRTVSSPSTDSPKRKVAFVKKSKPSDSIRQHPLFRPEAISTHVALLEIDFNLHKSNSTYFTDLDVGRIKLMARIMAPAWPLDNMPIEYKGRDGAWKREKVKGRAALILGATYTSFRHEMGAYISYDVESRILGWDSRWIYVGSWFVGKRQSTGQPKQIFASSLSKYIIKKGRITVQPDLFLTESGWIPARPVDLSSRTGKDCNGKGDGVSNSTLAAESERNGGGRRMG
ncbi:hypothetical protein TOPH_08454 [Tolypocladium ophioglossoides CBS 100239]|uniref:Protein THEM6 n=1 Tax=Tolypocladium ophioglossoides (strain CBS 100239) TaxID=1163406 RepID=A0A0L0MYN7_TOLOC|nr:hypothetical protein TOPH_08454 [Tolypocladium ophioglossoides CBS 100239]